MIKVSKRYCNNDEDAIDTLNTSFMKIIKNLNSMQDINTFYGWVKQITVRTSIDNFRASKIYNERNKFTLDNEYSNASNTLEATDYTGLTLDKNEIFNLINELPNTTKEVLNLVAIDGFSHKEAAEMLQISEENSRWHLSKGRKLMAQKLETLNNYNTNYTNNIKSEKK